MAHEHTHAHHDHGEEDNYFLDQCCMVTIAGAFGGICLALYFWKTKMLSDMLGKQFHAFVLVSGIALVVLAVVRAYGLWTMAGAARAHHEHAHDHDHSHDHHHEHGEHGHEHGHDCGHDHGHNHAHEHAHDHGHSHNHEHGHEHAHEHAHTHGQGHHHHDHAAEDHDHSWAPWRYVVMLVPICLFLLGLPSKGRQVEAADAKFGPEMLKESASHAVGLVGPGPAGWSQLVYVGYLGKDQVGADVTDFDFKNLATAVGVAASSPDESARQAWKDKAIRVIGQFAPSRQSDREFRLVRFKISCCANDAIPLDLPIISRESIANIKSDSWVRVTGRIEFRKRQGEIVPVIIVAGNQAVVPCPPDPNPYVQ